MVAGCFFAAAVLAVAPSCSDGGEDEGYAPLNLPVISVVTEGGAPITDKENYVGCNVTVYNTDDEYCIAKAAAGIRGRGNSTWTYDKKPYRIKFDKKTSLFGWEKNKSWVLLAMYQDFSNIKDYAAFSMSRAAGVQPYSPEAAHVELLLNGQYMGLYLLTEQVDENKGRADVEEDFSESDTRVPFLVELDEDAPDEGEEGVDYFSLPDGEGIRHYAVKYPKADERYTQQQFDYIKDYITAVNDVCHDGQATEEEVARLIDIPSFINYYLVQELMGQAEINWKSVFMSKTTDGKLVMGPYGILTGQRAAPCPKAATIYIKAGIQLPTGSKTCSASNGFSI